VATYWPEFAQAGKEAITVRCVLAQLAGIPVADAAPANSLYQPDVVVNALAAQRPLWEPGTTPCYHSFTHGPFCQKMVELIAGKTLGTFLREDLFGPLDIDFFVGLKPEEVLRCADVDVSENIPSLVGMKTPGTLLARAWKPALISNNFFQEDEFRRSEFVSGNGHSNASALAKLYGMLSLAGGEILSNEILEDAIREQWDGIEKMTSRHFRYGTGFMLNNPHFCLGKNPRNFGHPGLGGALGFADPDAHLGFGYCCNRIHPIDDTGPCGAALIDAVYACL
jgi:CubicO group peptidase (beta-lactamase class C family)